MSRLLRPLTSSYRSFSTHTSVHNAAASTNRAPLGAFADSATYSESLEVGLKFAKENGWDVGSLIEQPVIWGEIDSFQHLNNVVYVRYFETGRMNFIRSLVKDLPAGSDESLVKGKPGGMGVILGNISAKFKRPVTFPDTLLVAHRVKKIEKDRFDLEQMCWSLQQRAVTTTGDSAMVCYDYGALRKANMTPEFQAALKKRMPQ